MEHQKPEEQMNHAKKDLRNNLQRQRKGLDPAAIERLLQAAEAFERAHPGLVFEDSAETLHQMREEREVVGAMPCARPRDPLSNAGEHKASPLRLLVPLEG